MNDDSANSLCLPVWQRVCAAARHHAVLESRCGGGRNACSMQEQTFCEAASSGRSTPLERRLYDSYLFDGNELRTSAHAGIQVAPSLKAVRVMMVHEPAFSPADALRQSKQIGELVSTTQ